ncbi:MAG: hypothetical protein Q8S03_01150 [Brevundimonas sp.]|uniref:hypothetical protein n=1 Tax=Brevundimonas sp. TaxID=1871086 RepID=UPI00273626C3|nr:hypothetical protein [Brevundimonas sp.]MDP3403262.1 hypothetical protein [Brevundimonas sp.]
MRISFLLAALAVVTAAGPAAAQVMPYPGQPYIGDPMADQLRNRMEIQRQASAEQAAFARQHATEARLRALEIEAARQPEPYIRRELPLRSPEQERQAREQATARREAVVQGVGQIDDWLARTPR